MQIGIRSRLIVLAVLSAVPLVAVDLYEARQAQRDAVARAQREALLLASSFAAMADDIFDDTRYLLAGFGAGIEGQSAGLTTPGCERHLKRLLDTTPHHVNIVVALPDGKLACAAKSLSRPISVSDRKYFRDAFEHKAFALSDVIMSRDSGAPVLVAARPFLDAEERVTAVLLATFKLETFSRAFNRTAAGANVVTHLVNKDGKVIARWPHDPALLDRVLEGLGAQIKASPANEGVADLVGVDGVRRVSAYVKLRDIGGEARYVVTGIPRADLVKQTRAMIERDLLSLAATILIALILGFVGAHILVVKPVRRLTLAADRYGRGDLSARSGVEHGNDEIGKLAATFDALAVQNQRVTRALKTLSAGNRTLLRERVESELLQAMCKVAVDRGGYAAAYVCFPRSDGAKSIDIVARHGADVGFITAVPLTWADTEYGQGTIGRCIRSGEAAILHSIFDHPRAGTWQADALERGFKSVISLPLRVEKTLVGTLTLVAAEDGAFDEAEVELLDEMAADLSFGLEVIRASARAQQAEETARRALTHDAVVNLPNRAALLQKLDGCIQGARGSGEPVTVLDVHLGRLQDVFDSFGYEHGNAVLRQVAERISRLPGCEAFVGRLPIEDFGVVLPGSDAQAAGSLAHAVLRTFTEPFNIGGVLIDVQAAVGATFFPGHGEDAEVLMRRASIAAREAFRREAPYQVYGGATARENPARLSLAADLRAAIESRALMLHYQPKVEIASGMHCGSEALVRWRHPVRGMVSPLEFVALAEEISLIRRLTYQVIDMAVRQQHAWSSVGTTPVAINLSARNLHDPGLFDALDGFFGTWGVRRESIHFELTESALVDDPEAARRAITRLRDGGAKIYIDDFGTGYSSLNYLVKLPVHALKIDRSFIQQMTKSVEARSVVASIISMAHNLQLRVVAEGVETSEDFTMLRDMGCDEAQGYLIARPLDANAYEAWRQKRGRAAIDS